MAPEINGQWFEQTMLCLLFASTPKGRGVPFVMVGEPGAAKSALLEDVATRYGLWTCTVSPGLMGEAFFGVTPVPTSTIEDGEVLTFPPPMKVASIRRRKGAAMFFDEMNAVVSSAQLPAMLGALQDRRLGDEHFGPQCRVFAAMNPQHIAANGVRISIPQANRLSHWTWQGVSSKNRAAYLRSLSSSPEGRPWLSNFDQSTADSLRAQIEACMDEHFPSAWAATVAVVHDGFLSAHPAERQKMPSPSSKEAVGPWPSDRSWTNAMALMAAAEILISGKYPVPKEISRLRLRGAEYADLRDNLVASCVGNEAANLMSIFMQSMDLPSVDSWIAGNASHPKKKLGDNAVFTSNVLVWLRNNATKDRNQAEAFARGNRVMEYALHLADNEMLDLSIQFAQEIFASKIICETYICNNPPSEQRMALVRRLSLAKTDLDNLKRQVAK